MSAATYKMPLRNRQNFALRNDTNFWTHSHWVTTQIRGNFHGIYENCCTNDWWNCLNFSSICFNFSGWGRIVVLQFANPISFAIFGGNMPTVMNLKYFLNFYPLKNLSFYWGPQLTPENLKLDNFVIYN